MTKFGKLLAIFVAVASLAFAGFAIATTFGGPDWPAMINRDYFAGYTFTRGGAPEYLWTATRSSDDGQVGSSRRLPEVLSKVMDDILQRQQQQLQALNEREPVLTQRIEQLEQAIAADQLALTTYETAIRERLQQTRQAEEQAAAQVIAATNEAQKLENIVESRREDILRLRQQVRELQADQFRLQEIQNQLQNLLIQVQGDLDRAAERAEQLQQK